MADIRTVDYLGNALALPGLGRNVVTGTTGADSLTGTSGADTFISNGGADTLTGGAGDDTYVISDPNAKIVELAGGGVDTIKTLVNYVLPDNVENLVVYGFSGRSGTTGVGNSLANVITGDASNQILDGAGGNDVLTGGGGVDTFIFRAGSGHDVVTDFIGGAGGDVASLGGGLTFGSFKNIQDAMTQVGADVVLKLSGSDDVTFRNIKISDFTADNFTLPKPNFDGLKPTFDEEFNSPTLNVYDAKTKTGVWSTEFGYGGWGSKASHTISGYTGEKEIFVDSSYSGSGTTPLGLNPFHLHDGVLDLTAGLVPDAQKSSLWGFDYYSGLLTTNRSFAQTYGYFEVSVQMPTATATWPAFWLLPVGGGAPPEIDVFEYRGQEQGVLHESLHDKVFEGSQTGGTSFLPGAASGLHAYGVLWDPQHVTYYVDGRQVYQVDTPADMNKPMYLIVNMAVGAWAGTPDPSQFGGKASTLTVDYVRAYSLDQANAAVAQTAATADATKATADAAAKAAADKAAADAAAKAASDKAAADAAAKAASDKAAADAAAKAAADKAAADAAAKAAADKAAADAAAKAAADKAAADAKAAADKAVADAAAKAAADKAAADAKAAADKAAADAAAKEASDKAAADAAAKAAADKAAADATAKADAKAAADKAAADAAAKAAADKAAADAAAKAAADKAAADAAAKAQAEADAKAAADKAAADAAAKATADKAAADAAAKAAADQAAADAAAKAQAQAALDAAAKAAADKAAADAAAKAASDKAAADAAAKAAADAAAQAAAHTDSHTDGSDVAPPVSYSLSPTLKTYAYDGAGSVSIKGNALNNLLTGGAHDDTLDGGAGLDTLVGGDGNDTYIVANAGDVVTEAVGGGTDTVFTSVSWTVTPGSEIESLVATGSASVTLVGNAHAMSITGNAGLNTLDDGGAADTLAGGGGNDTYIVRNADTVLIEAAGAGYDTVKTSLSAYHLTDNVEVLTYTGSASFAGTGNAGANLITGGDGNDTLDGGGGGDRLVGGKGDDTYVIRSASDVVVEKAGGGFDVELATINTVRAAENVEVLKFVGVGNFTGYANLPGTDVIGGAGNDSLWGSKGADTLEGGGGNDLLFGGAGSDVFKLAGPGAGVARILDFHSGEDHIALDATAFGVTSLADVSFGSAPVSGHDSLVYDAKGRLYWDAGGDPAHQTLIATLDTHPTLHASDFILG